MKQLQMLKREKEFFGGRRLTTRAERARPRPLSTKYSMHVVLRSSQAKGEWSFRKKGNPEKIKLILHRYAAKYGVTLYSCANVGNHLHLHLKLANRHTYPAFIRSLTAALVLAITGASKLQKLGRKFWDYRPYTRIVKGRRGFLGLNDYIAVNQLEGLGWKRDYSAFFIQTNTA